MVNSARRCCAAWRSVARTACVAGRRKREGEGYTTESGEEASATMAKMSALGGRVSGIQAKRRVVGYACAFNVTMFVLRASFAAASMVLSVELVR